MRRSPPDRGITRSRTRCAIYTRKSSEEGLEQAFNSLDAQRETCEAYVLSQKHEGWVTLAETYDDGGISGGTMERPALKRLLGDIAAGKIDTVVVYKVDRLTRSLSDFAKLTELFDAHGTSFVSVTQSFNTTTSMGRLTLNMLLSFAQFEREVAGERIRDKIAASKRKGMWMGGLPPLGYDVAERKLIVNLAEAETVRNIFRRYAALGTVNSLRDGLDADGTRSKPRTDRFGRQTGGKPLSRGVLYLMLQNRIYRGEIVHKGATYPGEHEAIVDDDLWTAVQTRLLANRVDRRTGARAIEPSLLVGMIYDERGERMTPTHANKKGTRYRYYVSHNLIRRGRPKDDGVGRRLPAGELEGLVESRIVAFLSDQAALYDALERIAADAGVRRTLIASAGRLAQRWPELAASEKRAMLQTLIARIEVCRESIEIAVRIEALPTLLDPDIGRTQFKTAASAAPSIVLSIPIALRRTGKEMRLRIDATGSDPQTRPDRSLVRLLGQAHRFRAIVLQGNGVAIGVLAAEADVHPSYFTRVLKLAFLTPAITQAILEGRQPEGLSAKSLSGEAGRLAAGWAAQAHQLGIR